MDGNKDNILTVCIAFAVLGWSKAVKWYAGDHKVSITCVDINQGVICELLYYFSLLC